VAFWSPLADQVSYNDMLDNVPKDVPAIPSTWACPFPYQRLEVMWDGTVTVCYNDIFGRLAVGNVHERSLAECWTEGLSELRRLHREGLAHTIETCRVCPLRMSEMVKRGEMEPLPDREPSS
jgi:radical SAM protein with 4Fe4S-binding SPASM domain